MSRTKKLVVFSLVLITLIASTATVFAAVDWDHHGTYGYQNGLKYAYGYTYAYENGNAVYHYTRATLENWGSIRLDSGRCLGTGYSSAKSPNGDRELSARTYYGR